MINNYLTDPAPPEQNEQLAKLNQELPRPLPDSFVSWIKLHGGSSVRPDLAMPDEEGNGILDSFLSVDDIIGDYGSPGGFSATIPSEYVMVGYGPGCGVCLCLAVGTNYGSVWFADFDLANDIVPEGQTSEEIMMKLAPDWDTFLSSR